MNNASVGNQPSITIDDRMRDHVERSVRQFKGVPKSIINGKAEEFAEQFVSSEMGLTGEDGMKEGYKSQYIEMFSEEIIGALKP
jgi:hypothetical protein